MATITATTNKLNKNTRENLIAVPVTTWVDGTVLNTANESTYLGGLYNKDSDGTYFKWKTSAAFPISRLTTVNQSNFQKLINDFISEGRTLIIDADLSITSNITIPTNIILEIKSPFLINIVTGIILTINSRISAGNQQLFSGLGTVLIIHNEANICWWGAVGDGTTDSLPSFNNAKTAMPNGGLLKIPSGTFLISSSVSRFPNNFRIIGEGDNSTTLTFSGNAVSYFDVSYGVRVGDDYTLNNGSALFTFSNSTQKGDQYIDLKDSTFSSSFAVNDIIIIRNGGSYYDQDNSEQNVITKIDGVRIYLKYNLGKNYSVPYMQYYGITSSDFIQPVIGSTVSVSGTNLPTSVGRAYSYGNNIYLLQSGSSSTSSILLNPGRGNDASGTIIPSGTRVGKGRMILKSTRTKNFYMEGIRILSPSNNSFPIRMFRVDNSFGTTIKNCTIQMHPDLPPGSDATVYFTDNASNCLFDNVKFISNNPFFGTQISRSSGRNKFLNCQFTNVGVNVSEFAFDCKFNNCKFWYSYLDDTSTTVVPFIILGNSCNDVIFENNEIWASCANGNMTIFSSSEIQQQPIGDTDSFSISNNIIHSTRMKGIVYAQTKGVIRFNNNRISGTVGQIGSITREPSSTQVSGRFSEFKYNTCVIGITENTPTNAIIEIPGSVDLSDNYFEFVPTAGYDYTTFTKSIYALENTSSGQYVRIKNNKFKGFPIYTNYYYQAPDINMSNFEINGNNFTDNIQTSVNIAKNFVLNLRDIGSSQRGDSKLYSVKYRSKDVDLQNYIDIVLDNSGTINIDQYNAVSNFIKGIYENNLRNKILYFNPFAGDANAAVVPIYGWELGGVNSAVRTHRFAELSSLMSASDYNVNYGWSNDSAKFLKILSKQDVDITNSGLFLYVTSPSSTNNFHYIGTDNNYRLFVDNTNRLGSLGNSIVQTGFSDSVGFISATTTSGTNIVTNYLNTLNYPNTVITSSVTGSITNTTNANVLLTTHSSNSSGTTYKGTLGCIGLTSPLLKEEMLILESLVRILMSSFSRPVSVDNHYPIAINNVVNITNTLTVILRPNVYHYINVGSGNTAQLILPERFNIGDTYYIYGISGTYRVSQLLGQTIHSNSLTTNTGTSGYILSTAQYSNIILSGSVPNTDLIILSKDGTFNSNQ